MSEKRKSEIECICSSIIGEGHHQVVLNNHTIIFEYELPFTAHRYIQIDLSKNTLLIYTYDPRFSFDISCKEILYNIAACINEEMTFSNVEIDMQSLNFRYKSSQIFPDDALLGPLLEAFTKIHNDQFEAVREQLSTLRYGSERTNFVEIFKEKLRL